MKTSILFVVFLCTTVYSFGQYSRSFYSEETSNRRHSSIISIGGETTVISIRESSNDTLRVTLIDIDDVGETSNYRNYQYSPFDVSSAFVLSGVGVNSSGLASLCVLNPNGSGNINLSYINIDPITGVFSNYSFTNGQYRQGFSRTRTKGDSLISYLAQSSGSGIQRVAKSMSNTGISLEIATPSSTYSGNMFQNKINCELIIDGNNEYVSTLDKIIKRTNSNIYTEVSSLNFFDAPCMTVNTSGELFTLNRHNGDFEKRDGNLNTIASGTITELQNSPNSLTELYAFANDGIRVWSGQLNSSKIVDLDANSVVINEQKTRNHPLNQLNINSKQYVVGHDWNTSLIDIDGIPFQNIPNALTIVSDDLSTSISEFIEYDQELSSDKIRFHVNHVGRSFNIPSSGAAGFAFYQNNLWRNLIYSSSTNIIGISTNGDTIGSSISYNSPAATGPYCSPGDYTMEVMDKYNRGYFVTQEMIETHLFEITAGNPTYKIPFGIKEWPAHGDVSLGQATNLANFVDHNSNGNYEPELGEYPAIYGDQCLLNIFHQHPNTANSSSIETHQYYFTFNCDAETAIENAVFVRTHNFARSEMLLDTYAGDYVDFDIGNFSDDYVGTNVELGMIYGYNGDLFDEMNGGSIGFNDTVPAAGLLPLLGTKLDEDFTDNPIGVNIGESINGIGFGDGIVDNEYFTLESSFALSPSSSGLNPVSAFYNTMLGLHPNGSPKVINGVAIRHDFLGTSDPLFYSSYGIDHGNNYSEDSNGNPAGDRRMTCASGPMTLNMIDTLVLINAYLVGVDTINLSPDSSLIRLFENGQVLRNFYAQNSSVCGNTFDSYVSDNTISLLEEKQEQILVYPNPTNQQINFSGIQGEARVTIFDLNGRVVLNEMDILNNNGVDISSLEKAIYLISITDQTGTQVIRMIKQ